MSLSICNAYAHKIYTYFCQDVHLDGTNRIEVIMENMNQKGYLVPFHKLCKLLSDGHNPLENTITTLTMQHKHMCVLFLNNSCVALDKTEQDDIVWVISYLEPVFEHLDNIIIDTLDKYNNNLNKRMRNMLSMKVNVVIQTQSKPNVTLPKI